MDVHVSKILSNVIMEKTSKGPVQKILVRAANTNSEGPDEAAHSHSLLD